MGYHYSLIRFVPDAARGESVNLGAVAGDDDSRDWSLRVIGNPKRAKAIDEEGVLAAALGFTSVLEDHFLALEQLPGLGPEPMSVALLRRLSSEMRNVVQLSPPAPVVAEDAEEALDLVFEQLVVDPNRRRFPFEKKHRAVRSVREAYARRGVPEAAIERDAVVDTTRYRDRVDFGLHNGSVVQVVRCWSFQLPGQHELAEEVKAWAWLARDLRERGGRLRGQASEFDIPPLGEGGVAVVYVPPRADQPAQAFDEAQAAFRDAGVEAVPLDRADDVAGRMAHRLVGPH